MRGRGERGAGKGTCQFLLKKTLSGPDRVFLLRKTLSGPDRVFEANSKPQTQPGGVGGCGGGGEGEAGKGTGQFLLKTTLSGPDRVFLLKTTLSGPDRVFLLPNTLSGPDRVFEANSNLQNQPGGASGPTACWCQTRSLIWLNFGFLTSLIWR